MPARTQPVFEARDFIRKKDTLQYRILYPDGFDPAKKYPVLVFLHGAGERGTDNLAQLTHGSALFLTDSVRAAFPAVVIFPQCPPEDYWARVIRVDNGDGSLTFTFLPQKAATPVMKNLIAFLKTVQKEPWFDPARFYIGGLSMGGMGTFDLLNRQPDWFAGAFVMCGGSNPKTVKRFAKKVSIWMFHGEDDLVVRYEYGVAMKNAIEKAGGAVKFTSYPGVGHNAWDFAFKEPELLPWLFSHQKNR